MKRLLLLILLFPCVAFAQSDPLNSAYKPTVNTTCPNTTANGTGSNIWITDTMQKILQGNATAGTNCFQQVFATQGEFGDFQVHIVAPAGGYAGITVTSSSFVCSTGPTCSTPFTIAAPSTSSNNIVVHREAYHTIGTITNTAPAYYGTTGAYPDALIPAIDPYFHQNTSAFPVAVAASKTQSAWVDIFVPQNAPSGYYLGTITVSDSTAGTLAQIPVILAVWQWPSAQGGHMPSTSSVQTNYQTGFQDFCAYEAYGAQGNSAACANYPPAAGNSGNGQLIGQLAGTVMFLDHRISMTNSAIPTSYTPWLNGTNNYQFFNTIIPSAKMTYLKWNQSQPIATYASQMASNQSQAAVQACDEPSGATVTSSCNPTCDTAHAQSFPIRCGYPVTIEIFCALTGPPPPGSTCTANVGGVIHADDLVVQESVQLIPPQNNPPNFSSYLNDLYIIQSWLGGSGSLSGLPRKSWSYVSCSTGGTCGNGTSGSNQFNYPADNIDGRPVNNRAQEWMIFREGKVGELSFSATCMWESVAGGGNCPSGQATTTDPWTSIYLFGNNGDGTLAYASTYGGTVHHVTQPNGSPLGTEIWIPSIRLKLKRDGLQDYEYLQALTTAGQGSYVTTQINSWITDLAHYDSGTYTGAGLTAARTNIGNTLHQLTFPASSFPASGCAIQGSGPNWSCAASAATSDVTGAIAGAPDGAVVTFQLGSYTVTGPQDVSLTKGITFICQTAPNGIGAATGATGCNITVNSGYFFGRAAWPGSGQYFTKLYRVSGFNFVSWPTNTRPIFFGSGAAAVNEGVFTNLRMDHNTFQTTAAQAPCNPTPCQDDIAFIQSGHRSYFYGAIDHNLQLAAVSSHFLFGSNAQMDPFTPPNPLGTPNTLTLEDNTLTTTSETNPGEGVLDWDYGLQPIVFRHNTVTDSDLTTHYTVTGFEVYNNQFIKDAGSPNPDCYRAVHLQTTALSEDFNNQFTCSGGSGQPVVLSLGTIREGYKVDPRLWPTTLKPTGFVSHPPFTDGNRPPSQTNQGYPYLYQPTRDIATGALTPYYAWNNTINGPTFHAISVEDFGFVQVPDYYTNHLQPNRDFYQSVVGAQTSTTSPWNCSTTPGMGWGPLANQPPAASCPAYAGEVGGGYGYAAQTVTGTIGSSASGTASDTVLYQLGASGWKQIYKPYPYPHPLVAGTTVTQLPASSIVAGPYQAQQSPVFSCPDAGAVLYITTDGTAPNRSLSSFTSPHTVTTVASGQETINAMCSLGGTTVDSLTRTDGYYINATAFSAWPTQPGTYPAGTQAIQISNPGQNVQICATDDGSTPTSSGANNGLCGHTHYTNPILIGGINQFVKFSCTATCTVAFMTTGVNLTDSPVTTVHYTLGGSNGLWWEDVGGSDATITNFAIGGTAVVNNFGSQPIGVQSGTLPIYLNNIGSISTIAGGLPSTQPTQSTVINSITITGSSAFTRANVTGTGGECGAVPITINAGSYCNLQFVFNPTVAGSATATVAIADNTAGTTHTITLTGTGGGPSPTATLTPSPLAFGNQNINATSAGLPATLTNTGTVPVAVSQAQVFGTNFTLTNTGTCFTTFGSNTSFTLPAGQACTYIITFNPTATIGYTGTFQVTDNATGSPQIINLTGQGTQAMIAWSSPQGATTYNYGNVLVLSPTNSAALTLQNTGTGPLNVAATITGTPPGPAQFSIQSTTCPNPLPAGQSCMYIVTFTPSTAISYTAFLTETDALASNSPQNLTLNGTGVTSVPITAPWPVMIISQNRSPKNETDSAFGSNVAYLRRRGFGANPPSGTFVDRIAHDWHNWLQRL